MRFHEGDVRLRRRGLDDHGLEFRFVFRRVQRLLQIIVADPQPFLDLRQAFSEGLRVIAQQQNAKGWVAIHQHAAFAIEHLSAWRNDGNRTRAVAVRQVRKMPGLNHLQLPESDHQQHDENYRKVGNQRQPALRDFLIVNVP